MTSDEKQDIKVLCANSNTREHSSFVSSFWSDINTTKTCRNGNGSYRAHGASSTLPDLAILWTTWCLMSCSEQPFTTSSKPSQLFTSSLQDALKKMPSRAIILNIRITLLHKSLHDSNQQVSIQKQRANMNNLSSQQLVSGLTTMKVQEIKSTYMILHP